MLGTEFIKREWSRRLYHSAATIVSSTFILRLHSLLFQIQGVVGWDGGEKLCRLRSTGKTERARVHRKTGEHLETSREVPQANVSLNYRMSELKGPWRSSKPTPCSLQSELWLVHECIADTVQWYNDTNELFIDTEGLFIYFSWTLSWYMPNEWNWFSFGLRKREEYFGSCPFSLL